MNVAVNRFSANTVKCVAVTLMGAMLVPCAAAAQMMGDQGLVVSGITPQPTYTQPQVQPQTQPQAQSTVLAPWANTPTSAVQVAGPTTARMVTLFPGFSPDPTTSVVTAGGTNAALAAVAQSNAACRGNFASEPQVLWVSAALPYLRIIARATSVLTMLVRAPNGAVFCSAGTGLYDTTMDLRTLTTGRYEIFVGTASGTTSATVVFTKDPTYSPMRVLAPSPVSTVVVSAQTPNTVPTPTPITPTVPTPAVPTAQGTAAVPAGWVSVDNPARIPASTGNTSTTPNANGAVPASTNGAVVLDAAQVAGTVQTQRGAAVGRVPLRFLSRGCLGFGERRPTTTFLVRDGVAFLRTAVHADQDTTIALRSPSGTITCADDVYGVHPGLDLASPVAGRWEVFIGTYAPRTLVHYEFSIATDRNFTPRAD